MIESFFEKWDIPENCALNKRVFKKLFEENTKLDATDKKALRDDVQEIRWLYTLKPATLNVPPYMDAEREYPEVAILLVSLSSSARARRIATLVQRAIPYPLVLVLAYGSSIALNLADKRINQADKEKWVIETTFDTGWIDLSHTTDWQEEFLDDLSIRKLSFLHFYALYQDLCHRVVALNAASYSGRYEMNAGEDNRQERRLHLLRELQRLEQSQAELRNKLKKESQLGRQVALNSEIHRLAEQVERIKQDL